MLDRARFYVKAKREVSSVDTRAERKKRNMAIVCPGDKINARTTCSPRLPHDEDLYGCRSRNQISEARSLSEYGAKTFVTSFNYDGYLHDKRNSYVSPTEISLR